MLSSEFEKYFDQSWSNNYLGWFSSNNYPNFTKNYQFFIVNKDSSDQSGSHWMSCFFIDNQIEFFDPLGADKNFVENFLNFDSNYECIFNETPVQPFESKSCGQFCVYFCFKRILNRDLSFRETLNFSFSKDNQLNEIKVIKFCKEILNYE